LGAVKPTRSATLNDSGYPPSTAPLRDSLIQEEKMLVFNEDKLIKPRPYLLYGFMLAGLLAAIILIPT
jgi:hypothetical protein